MRDGIQYVRARHVATMTQRGVITDGCVAIRDGRIVAVAPASDFPHTAFDVEIDGLLTPGLVNAHTHLELTNLPRPSTPGTFQQWLLASMAATREDDVETFNRKRVDAVRAGIGQCLRFGVTFVGDVSQNVGIVRPVIAASPLRAVSFGECLGLGARRTRFDALLDAAADASASTDRLAAGVSPHAPYTVTGADYAQSHVRSAHGLGGFWTTHLAETADEWEFVRERSGPFAELYRTLGFDPGPVERGGRSIVDWLYRHIAGRPGDLLAHVNYCDDADLSQIAEHGSSVAWCPRTHAYFGHPPHRWRDMLARGISVCVATDSCASSPDLNVMDDLRLVRSQNPDVPAETLWDMVTFVPGNILAQGRGTLFGKIAGGAAADVVAWPTYTEKALDEVLDAAGMLPSRVWIGGVAVDARVGENR